MNYSDITPKDKAMLQNAMCCIYESYPSAYWAAIDYDSIVHERGEIQLIKLSPEEDDGSKRWLTITPELLFNTAQKLMAGQIKCSDYRESVADFIGSPEDWVYDLHSIDVLVQFACFNEVKYS